jgi:hypothetical protein
MYALMFDQTTLMTESVTAYTTGVWPLPTMYALMCDKIKLLNELLFT